MSRRALPEQGEVGGMSDDSKELFRIDSPYASVVALENGEFWIAMDPDHPFVPELENEAFIVARGIDAADELAALSDLAQRALAELQRRNP